MEYQLTEILRELREIHKLLEEIQRDKNGDIIVVTREANGTTK
jgi:hypothetical protein